MDFHSVLNIVETACRQFSDPATHAEADHTLQQFRASPAPYQACQYILEHAADHGAKFQAVLALRDAALREWGGLEPQMRLDLLQFCLQAAIMKFGADPQPLVRRQAAGTAAVLLKRLWGEAAPEQRRAVINEISTLAARAGTAQGTAAGMEVLNAIVAEFSPATASSMGLPWDYHEQCRRELQNDYLLEFLEHALRVASQAAHAALSAADGGACLASLHLLSSLLGWSYCAPPALQMGGPLWSVMRQAGEASALHVRPPPTWREPLLRESAFAWLPPLATAMRDSRQLAASPLGGATRQLLVQLCGMAGDIFVREGDRRQLGLLGAPGAFTRGRHLQWLLLTLLPALHAASGEVILDACRALLAAAAAHRASGFFEAAAGMEGGEPALLGALSQVTVAALTRSSDESEACGDVLLEMWSELVVDPCRGSAVPGSGVVADPAAAVFAAAMQRELAKAAACAWEDEDEYQGGEEAYGEAWMAGLAAIGRAACAIVLPALESSLQECQAALQGCMQRNEDPSSVLEQLCWLTRMCAHVLADSGEGETPAVPVAVAEACAASAAAGRADPTIGLARALLALGAVCQQHAGEAVISPRLIEEVACALGRWAETYLAACATPTAAAEALVRLATAALTRYPGDKALHRAACSRLLAPLVRQLAACGVVVRCQAWGELCGATAARAEWIKTLEAGVQRRLLQCLVQGALGLGEQQGAAEAYVTTLLSPLLRALLALDGVPAATLQQPDRSLSTLNVVQSLRGAARGSTHATHAVVFAHLESVQPVLLRLLTAYQGQPAVYSQILKLGADLVEYHGSMLPPGPAKALLRWAVQLVASYASHRITGVAAALEEERKALCALLRLLTQLTNAEGSDEDDVAAAVFEGLDRIMPSVGQEHLKIPKLRAAFFALVAHAIEAHPARAAHLPPHAFLALMAALGFGIGVHDDAETAAAVFEAIAALARYHLLACRAGAAGLGPLNVSAEGGSVLGGLLQLVLRRVLVEDPGFEVIEYSAEAVLPLWLAEPGAVESSLGALSALVVGAASASAAAATAFQGLESAAQAAGGLDRQGRRQFQAAFRKFVLEVRGVVRQR